MLSMLKRKEGRQPGWQRSMNAEAEQGKELRIGDPFSQIEYKMIEKVIVSCTLIYCLITALLHK